MAERTISSLGSKQVNNTPLRGEKWSAPRGYYMEAKPGRIIIKRLSFILRFCVRSGAGERWGGGTIRFVFYKAAFGCWVKGYQDRGLEPDKRVGVSRVDSP